MDFTITAIIFTALVIAILVVVAYKHFSATPERIGAIKDFIYSLVLQAESDWGSGTGEAKFALVVQKFYELCPVDLRRLVNPSLLQTLIEQMVGKMKEWFVKNPKAENAILGSEPAD